MSSAIAFQFEAAMWKYSGNAGWYFVSLPQEITHEIRTYLKWQEEGWGRMKAKARIGHTEWETAIWYDSKLNTYLLPIKAIVRKKEHLQVAKPINICIWI